MDPARQMEMESESERERQGERERARASRAEQRSYLFPSCILPGDSCGPVPDARVIKPADELLTRPYPGAGELTQRQERNYSKGATTDLVGHSYDRAAHPIPPHPAYFDHHHTSRLSLSHYVLDGLESCARFSLCVGNICDTILPRLCLYCPVLEPQSFQVHVSACPSLSPSQWMSN
ncbi:hypothetical protein MPTK1_4g19380 [Marchantia polymorpha subsp. ruderalis]|uniref:Uncharacterized protein n=2 Tax=Marchantia polymorpha TaxID=3197 RepID=A0AAF6BBK4_MARPO|nr:hypothetical protein MARPO_0169s0006 [Marchantia polymorpha]BBN09388.1 hypothetical protein Mp_4g19380 [Marchantia polymorpha subsp. ruderalis]|eukprot:PTQ28241.1 hypothetical protein MARPO_0169s0006 [Marchantia polymorpha]